MENLGYKGYMILLFWLCTFLLVIAALGARYWSPARDGAFILVVIDLVILGMKTLGFPR